MLEKRVTALLYGSDRNLWSGGTLDLRVTDLFAPRGPRVLYQGDVQESTVDLKLDLPFDAGQLYAITFSAPHHRPAWRFLRRPDFIRTSDQVERDDLIVRLMLVPDTPGTTDVANGFGRLAEIASPFAIQPNGIDTATFQALDVAAQMAFLNVEAKLRETIIDGTPVISFVRAIRHVAVDRVFLAFDSQLKARMQPSKDFAAAPGHKAPKGLDLPAHPDSWKHTRFATGNMQLSFSAETARLDGDRSGALVHSADVDIDLGRGLAHAKEWLDNNVFRPGHKTNQALVYGLLYTQGILPKYTLDPAPSTTRQAPRLRSMARAPQPAGPRRRATPRPKAKGRPRAIRSSRVRKKSR